jgi:hypothetical protein
MRPDVQRTLGLGAVSLPRHLGPFGPIRDSCSQQGLPLATVERARAAEARQQAASCSARGCGTHRPSARGPLGTTPPRRTQPGRTTARLCRHVEQAPSATSRTKQSRNCCWSPPPHHHLHSLSLPLMIFTARLLFHCSPHRAGGSSWCYFLVLLLGVTSWCYFLVYAPEAGEYPAGLLGEMKRCSGPDDALT